MLTEISRHIFNVFVAVNVSRCPDQYGTERYASIFGENIYFWVSYCSFAPGLRPDFATLRPHTYKASIQASLLIAFRLPPLSLTLQRPPLIRDDHPLVSHVLRHNCF